MKHLYLVLLFIPGCTPKEVQHSNNTPDPDSIQSSAPTQPACDSIPKDYFSTLDFPFHRLDSIHESDINPGKFLPFTPCDNLLFNKDRTDVQTYSYLSMQDTTDYYSVLVYRQMDMENCLFIFSFDKNNLQIDSELLFCVGGGLERQTNVLIDGKIVNTLHEEKKAIFTNNKYISSYKEYYSLLDTLTN